MGSDSNDQISDSILNRGLDTGANLIAALTRKFAETAEKGTGVFLLSMGAALTAVSIFLRTKYLNGPVIGLAEFIVIFSGGVLLAAGGAFIKVFVFYTDSNIIKKQQQVNGELAKDALQRLTKIPENVHKEI